MADEPRPASQEFTFSESGTGWSTAQELTKFSDTGRLTHILCREDNLLALADSVRLVVAVGTFSTQPADEDIIYDSGDQSISGDAKQASIIDNLADAPAVYNGDLYVNVEYVSMGGSGATGDLTVRVQGECYD